MVVGHMSLSGRLAAQRGTARQILGRAEFMNNPANSMNPTVSRRNE